MASRSEKQFEKAFVEKLKAFPGAHVIPKTHPYGVKGILDRYACINGHFVGLEFKKHEKAKRDPIQEWEVAKIRDSGGTAFFVYPENEGSVLARLRELSKSP